MGAFIDLTGKKLGDWNVIRYLGNSMWECMDDDGIVKNIHSYTLRTKESSYTKVKDRIPEGVLGHTFGQWTPMKYLGGGLWECKCSCGNISKVSTGNLKSGTSTKCMKCKAISSLADDFTNQKINEWTVMYYAGNMRWHCRCSCGVEKDVLSKYLKDRSAKSCGHDRNYHIIRDDITGRRFGSLLVLGYTGADNMWKCQCDCGKVKNIHRDSLMTGKTRSCGCLKEKLRANTLMEKYGDTNTNRINNPREEWQIQVISDKNLLQQFISQLGNNVTAADLAIKLNVNDTSILKALKKFDMLDIVEHNTGVSDLELSIVEWIRSLGIYIETGDRKILNGKELDIYIPSKKIAIEFNGTYWHSSIFKELDYHQNKTIQCARNGIQLIHIFEYEWRDSIQREKIKDYLRTLLVGPKYKVYARNTTVKYINVEKTKEFLNRYHLQGYSPDGVRLGCYNNDQLIGVMTFGKPRFQSSYDYEVIRLCWHSDYSVMGGTEKLFKKFIQDYSPASVVTYSDISKFTGNVYSRLGFKADINSITKPSYIWVDAHNSKVLSRYQTMTKKLISDGLGKEGQSETEIMESLGYIKIFNSGNLRLVWQNNN